MLLLGSQQELNGSTCQQLTLGLVTFETRYSRSNTRRWGRAFPLTVHFLKLDADRI